MRNQLAIVGVEKGLQERYANKNLLLPRNYRTFYAYDNNDPEIN